MQDANMDTIYFKDDYPRAGCSIKISIPDDPEKSQRGWGVSIYAPTGEVIEVYAASSLEGALTVARCLAKGEQVPKGYDLIK